MPLVHIRQITIIEWNDQENFTASPWAETVNGNTKQAGKFMLQFCKSYIKFRK